MQCAALHTNVNACWAAFAQQSHCIVQPFGCVVVVNKRCRIPVQQKQDTHCP
jgi:Tfp pilus assembly protein FimT